MWHFVQQWNTSHNFLCSSLRCASIRGSSCIWKLLSCSVVKSCKRGKSEKNFDATRFCHRGNCLKKFCRRGMSLKRRFQFNHTHIQLPEVGKAQLEAQHPQLRKLRCALMFLFWNIVEVALRTKVFKICCALIALRFQNFFSGNSANLYIDLNFAPFRLWYG